jgi:hypothetical protein
MIRTVLWAVTQFVPPSLRMSQGNGIPSKEGTVSSLSAGVMQAVLVPESGASAEYFAQAASISVRERANMVANEIECLSFIVDVSSAIARST